MQSLRHRIPFIMPAHKANKSRRQLGWEPILSTYFVGVDGGGTKCRMRLVDQDLQTLAQEVIDTPSNLQVRNGNSAYSAVNDLTKSVFEKAGLGEEAMAQTYACFGMAGGRLPSDREAFENRTFPFAKTKVFDDIDIAQAGAHLGGEGAVLIIGTGSAGMGLMDGKRYQIGGWGFLVGDTMSGGILGRELLRLSLLAHDGIVEGSELTKEVMSRFNGQGDQMMAWSFDNPDARSEMMELHEKGVSPKPAGLVNARPADYGQFVPLILQYFERGDAIARQLVEFEHQAIDQYVNWFKARGAKSIAIVGGLGQALIEQLQERHGDIITMPKSEPLNGAVILARQSAE